MYVDRKIRDCCNLDQNVIVIYEKITRCGHKQQYCIEGVILINMTIKSLFQERESPITGTYPTWVLISWGSCM